MPFVRSGILRLPSGSSTAQTARRSLPFQGRNLCRPFPVDSTRRILSDVERRSSTANQLSFDGFDDERTRKGRNERTDLPSRRVPSLRAVEPKRLEKHRSSSESAGSRRSVVSSRTITKTSDETFVDRRESDANGDVSLDDRSARTSLSVVGSFALRSVRFDVLNRRRIFSSKASRDDQRANNSTWRIWKRSAIVF